jgi:hypothetical protein
VTGQGVVKGVGSARARAKGIPPSASPLGQSASAGALGTVKRPLGASSNYGQRAKKAIEDNDDDVSVISTGSTVVSTVVSSRSRPGIYTYIYIYIYIYIYE